MSTSTEVKSITALWPFDIYFSTRVSLIIEDPTVAVKCKMYNSHDITEILLKVALNTINQTRKM